MTITLHWWMLPIVVFLAGVGLAKATDDGHPLNFLPAFIFFVAAVAAVCLVLGHFL